MAVRLTGSKDPHFWGLKKGVYYESPKFVLRTWLKGLLKYLQTPYRMCVRREFWRYHYL